MLEHQIVMSRMLGRSLLPGESVHHRNGNKADNREENLELWVKPQPTGIRVPDAVAWAREILARYGDGDGEGTGQAQAGGVPDLSHAD